MTDKLLRLKGREFRCIAAVPPSLVFDIAEAETSSNEARRLLMLREAMRTLVVDDEHEALHALLADREDPPTLGEIDEAIGALLREYSGRPTGRPSASPSGSRGTVGERRVVSLSRPATPRPSTDGISEAS